MIIAVAVKIFSNNDKKTLKAENAPDTENSVQKFLEERPLNLAENLVETEISKNIKDDELLKFRQEKIRAHSMGRGGTKQSLLKKQVFLTFDDGPSTKSTEEILDILKDKNIKATFFVVGKNVEKNPEIFKRIYDEGHAIGIHTYDHEYEKIYKSPEALEEDIKKCDDSIKNVLGEDFHTNLYRFPGGSYRDNKEEFVKKVEELGYVYFDWNALNGDAERKNPDEEFLIERFKKTSNGYNVIISLMHDTNAKTNTVKTLPQIIDMLKDEGYEFKTLGDV